MTGEPPGRADWDAIVVGAGVGGLVCAAYLAVSGRRVLVLEQHDVAGGNSQVFRRRRAYEFDVGVHYIGDCGAGGILPAILSGLGLSGRVPFRQLDPDGFDHIVLPGLTVRVPAGWPEYRARLLEALPGEEAGIDSFTDIVSTVAGEQRRLLLAAEPPGSEVLRGMPTLIRWARRTLAELFDHCGLSCAARAVLAGQSPNYGMSPDEAPVTMHANMLDQYLRGAYYPVGGGQMLAAGLVEVIEAYGGEVRTRAPVRRILIDDHRAAGVVSADGELHTAPVVVSNADYRRTILELAGPEHFPPSLVANTRRAAMALPFLSVYVALDRELEPRPNANIWWYRHADIDRTFRQVRDGYDEPPVLYVSFASTKDPDSRTACPRGHANFQLITICPPGHRRWGVEEGPAEGGRYRRSARYLREKDRLTEAVLTAGEHVLGPFRDHIVHLEAATPLTHERYTRSTGGTPFGLARWGSGVARPDTRTTVAGLHVVGQSTRHGLGITGVALSGIACAAQVTGRPLMHEVHSGAVLGDPARLPARAAGWDPLAVSRGARRRHAPGLAKIDN